MLLPSGTWDASRYLSSLAGPRGPIGCRRAPLSRRAFLPLDFQELGVPVTHSNTEVVCGSDVVFIAVKPHLVPHILSEISQHVTDRHIIVSVAAGVTLATLEEVSLMEAAA